jgi:hypothetical protein
LPKSGGGCATRPEIPGAAVGLVETVQQLGSYQAAHHPPDDRWQVLRHAIDRAATLDPRTLALPVRIVVQNAALRIAIYGRDQPELARAAMALVDKLAPSRAELVKLGTEPNEMQGWLGASDAWVHRDRRTAPGLHAMLHQNVKYFRPVRAGATTRAVFSQLIAIDDHGDAHLTPIVGELELRAGADASSAACVAEVDLFELACFPPGLRVIDPSRHPESHFLRRIAGDKVGCNGCHDANTFALVPAADAPALIATEMQQAVAEATRLVAAVRAK